MSANNVDYFKCACRLHTRFMIARYLMSNAHGRWDGAEKAMRHIELCKFYVAVLRGFDHEDDVGVGNADFKAVHELTQQLTDNLDEAIGFPLDGKPDYEKLAHLFFEQFHALAIKALSTEN